jgi:hypothetical protein
MQLIALRGNVVCSTQPGAVGLSLQGEPAAAATAAVRGGEVQVLFSGVARIDPPLPARVRDARVLEIEADGAAPATASDIHDQRLRRFRIESVEGHFEVWARGLQLHRDAHAAFFAVLPRSDAPLAMRWSWSLLLSLLRLAPLRWLLSRR